MKLVVNGETVELGGAGGLPALLAHLGAIPDQVAVMVNDEVVPQARRAQIALAEGDRIEVLSFCGGGSGR